MTMAGPTVEGLPPKGSGTLKDDEYGEKPVKKTYKDYDDYDDDYGSPAAGSNSSRNRTPRDSDGYGASSAARGNSRGTTPRDSGRPAHHSRNHSRGSPAPYDNSLASPSPSRPNGVGGPRGLSPATTPPLEGGSRNASHGHLPSLPRDSGASTAAALVMAAAAAAAASTRGLTTTGALPLRSQAAAAAAATPTDGSPAAAQRTPRTSATAAGESTSTAARTPRTGGSDARTPRTSAAAGTPSSAPRSARPSGAEAAAGAVRPPRPSEAPAPVRTPPPAGPTPDPDAIDALIANAPPNIYFVTPIFPQLPITKTDSSNSWAIMLEAGCQTLESVLGPLLEAVLCEMATGGKGGSGAVAGSWETSLERLGLPLPPFSAGKCLEVMSKHTELRESKLPVTIRKRVEAAVEAVTLLRDSPEKLDGAATQAGQSAMRSILQDVLKAMRLPSLLRTGSRQFLSFSEQVRPELESSVMYLDMLLEDSGAALKIHDERKKQDEDSVL